MQYRNEYSSLDDNWEAGDKNANSVVEISLFQGLLQTAIQHSILESDKKGFSLISVPRSSI
jgi:hypothetical protein